jgi:hypothetical protein
VEGEEGEYKEEVGEDEDEEVENLESDESDEGDDEEEQEEQDMILLRIDVERRCLSHFTAYVYSRDTCLLWEMIY